MYKCSHPCCQFQDFFKNKYNRTYYFYEDDNCDTYCIFHAPKKIKEKFRILQVEYFERLIFDYIQYIKIKTDNSKYINFSKVVFINNSFYQNKKEGLDLSGYKIDFSEAIFLKNIRFDNLKCKKLIFKDSVFLDGGGIKNRKENKNLQIEELIFKPYRVDSDFVIDIGQYINRETALVEMKQGVIEEIQFENHKIGDGYIFFIGINKYTKEAHFENMLLDKVYFQNCDLSNCYFLNAKVVNTEFRNCEFPWNENLKIINILKSKESRWEFVIAPMFFLFTPFIINIALDAASDTFLNWMGLWFYLIMVLYIIIALVSLDIWIEFLSFYIAKLLFGRRKKRKNLLNKLYHKSTTNKHIAIADEIKIYKKLATLNYEDTKLIVQIQKTLTSLRATYGQLQSNFKEKDFQISGDFFYSKRYTELVSVYGKSITEFFVLSLHHMTNGFGERFVKPFIWSLMTFFIFTVIFTFILKANQDYIATPDTPLYLIVANKKKSMDDNTTSYYQLDRNESFIQTLHILNADKLKSLKGFNIKGDYNISSQSILRLKSDDINIGMAKSLGNVIYPFSLKTRQWFQDVTVAAYILSVMEMMLLWYFAGAFILALWHRIKRQ